GSVDARNGRVFAREVQIARRELDVGFVFEVAGDAQRADLADAELRDAIDVQADQLGVAHVHADRRHRRLGVAVIGDDAEARRTGVARLRREQHELPVAAQARGAVSGPYDAIVGAVALDVREEALDVHRGLEILVGLGRYPLTHP